jgi:hypothetical protein
METLANLPMFSRIWKDLIERRVSCTASIKYFPSTANNSFENVSLEFSLFGNYCGLSNPQIEHFLIVELHVKASSLLLYSSLLSRHRRNVTHFGARHFRL